MMTLKQGEEVNKKFDNLEDSIASLNKKIDSVNLDYELYQRRSGRRLQGMYESYWEEYEKNKIYRAEADSFRRLYTVNKRMYEVREYDFRKERIHQQVFTLVVMFVAVFFAAK